VELQNSIFKIKPSSVDYIGFWVFCFSGFWVFGVFMFLQKGPVGFVTSAGLQLVGSYEFRFAPLTAQIYHYLQICRLMFQKLSRDKMFQY